MVIALGVQLFHGSRAAPEKKNVSRLDALSGVRAPMILLIFFYHAQIVSFNAVGAFIMLSGATLSAFLIGWRLGHSELRTS